MLTCSTSLKHSLRSPISNDISKFSLQCTSKIRAWKFRVKYCDQSLDMSGLRTVQIWRILGIVHLEIPKHTNAITQADCELPVKTFEEWLIKESFTSTYGVPSQGLQEFRNLREVRMVQVDKALASLPLMWSGFEPQSQRHMWVEFAVGYRACSKRFSPGTRFSPHFKNQHSQVPIRSEFWGATGLSVTSTVKCHLC